MFNTPVLQGLQLPPGTIALLSRDLEILYIFARYSQHMFGLETQDTILYSTCFPGSNPYRPQQEFLLSRHAKGCAASFK